MILGLLNDVREVLVRQLDHPVNNADIIEKSLKLFLEKFEIRNEAHHEPLDFNTYIQVPEKGTEQKIFLTAETSLKRLVKVVENHAKVCDGSLACKKSECKRTCCSSEIQLQFQQNSQFAVVLLTLPS